MSGCLQVGVGQGLTANAHEKSLWDNGNVLKSGCEVDYTTLQIY